MRERGERGGVIERYVKVLRVFQRRNGSGIVPGDIRREMVRDEPRADRHILPGRDEKVPKGESVDTLCKLRKVATATPFFTHDLRFREKFSSFGTVLRVGATSVLRLSRNRCRLFCLNIYAHSCRRFERGRIDMRVGAIRYHPIPLDSCDSYYVIMYAMFLGISCFPHFSDLNERITLRYESLLRVQLFTDSLSHTRLPKHATSLTTLYFSRE